MLAAEQHEQHAGLPLSSFPAACATAGCRCSQECVGAQESMRLYPVVPIIFRKAMRKLRVGSFTIPKGAFFIVHIMATHTSERYWERAADFLPVTLPLSATPAAAFFLHFLQSPSLSNRGFSSERNFLCQQAC